MAVVVPRTTLQPETTGTYLFPSKLCIMVFFLCLKIVILMVVLMLFLIFLAVPEWFAAGSFGLVTLFTLLLRNVPDLQSNLL